MEKTHIRYIIIAAVIVLFGVLLVLVFSGKLPWLSGDDDNNNQNPQVSDNGQSSNPNTDTASNPTFTGGAETNTGADTKVEPKPEDLTEQEQEMLYIKEYYTALANNELDKVWEMSYWETGRNAKKSDFLNKWYDGLIDVTYDVKSLGDGMYNIKGTLIYSGGSKATFDNDKKLVWEDGQIQCMVTCKTSSCKNITECKAVY